MKNQTNSSFVKIIKTNKQTKQNQEKPAYTGKTWKREDKRKLFS